PAPVPPLQPLLRAPARGRGHGARGRLRGRRPALAAPRRRGGPRGPDRLRGPEPRARRARPARRAALDPRRPRVVERRDALDRRLRQPARDDPLGLTYGRRSATTALAPSS